MSEPTPTPDSPTPPATTTDDVRLLPGIVYGLYILSFFTVWFTTVIGVIMAYVLRDRAEPVARSHYDFLIGTFWWSIPPLLLAVMLTVIGIPLMLVLIGFPVLLAAGIVFLLWFVWFVVRCVVGAIHLARGEAYPRPGTLLV
jgi:uncharacterized membrane protein